MPGGNSFSDIHNPNIVIPPRNINPLDLEDIEILEIPEIEIPEIPKNGDPNNRLFEGMDTIRLQTEKWSNKVIQLNNCIKEMWEVQQDEPPDEHFREAIQLIKDEIFMIVGKINAWIDRKKLIQYVLIHNESDEGLHWQRLFNKRKIRQALGLPELDKK